MEEQRDKPSRSRCPVCAALETFGDKWSLLIVRDIMLFGKSTYGDFLQSPEGIATNILTDRLARLGQAGIINKAPDPDDGRRVRYYLTEKGIDLLPLIGEMMLWSAKHSPGVRVPERLVAALRKNREQALEGIRGSVERGEALL